MYERIMVPLDGSKEAERAYEPVRAIIGGESVKSPDIIKEEEEIRRASVLAYLDIIGKAFQGKGLRTFFNEMKGIVV